MEGQKHQEQAAQEHPERAGRRWAWLLPRAAVALLAVVAAVGTLRFYRYLDETLFRERSSHLMEISSKVTEVMEMAARYYRDSAQIAGNLLFQSHPPEEGIDQRLREIQGTLALRFGTVLAFDENQRLYAPEGASAGVEGAVAFIGGEELRGIAAEDRTGDASSILFINTLAEPLEVEEGRITHMGVAVDVSVFQQAFDADIFQGRSHVYVVDDGGSRLYRHICEQGFIDGPNLLDALKSCRFVHGGELAGLRRAVADRESAGYELVYQGERYFVASAPVEGTGWTVLTFVPTQVLGAGTTAFMNTTIVFISVIAAAVVVMMGLVISFVLTKRGDRRLIEHQRQANRLLREAADAANAASVAKSDFLSHMSHDIRTPINGIMGMTDIALRNLGDRARVEDCLRKIDSSSGHLLSLVNDVLDMSRIESGKTSIAREPMDMRQLATNCVSIIGGQIEGRRLSLVEEFGELEHPHVFGDELHLRQVLINILGNAVKFTPDGGTIWFRMSQLRGEGETAWFRLEVEDTGVGMAPEFLPRIFEPFSQEDGGNRTNYQGTGLGMSITKKFIDLMGGTIAVRSQPGKGSCFTVEIPAQIDHAPRAARMDEASGGELAGLRLLLVEDNELNMEIARYMLEDVGVEITEAPNGQAAVDIFAGSLPGTFDGILMDIMMPVMDGLTATRTIRGMEREDGQTIPIIAMTANAYDEDKRKCLEAGMDAHVAKPIDSELLFQVLSHITRPGRR